MIAAVISLGLGLALVATASTLSLVWATRRAIEAEQRAAQLEVALGATTIARQQAEAQLQQTARDLSESHRRHEAQLAILREGAGEIIADDATPDAARAAALKLLQNAAARDRAAASTGGDDPAGLPRSPATDAGAGGDG